MLSAVIFQKEPTYVTVLLGARRPDGNLEGRWEKGTDFQAVACVGPGPSRRASKWRCGPGSEL